MIGSTAPGGSVAGGQALAQEFMSAISGVHPWDFRRWAEALQVMRERPRRRTLQTVPERIRQ